MNDRGELIEVQGTGEGRHACPGVGYRTLRTGLLDSILRLKTGLIHVSAEKRRGVPEAFSFRQPHVPCGDDVSIPVTKGHAVVNEQLGQFVSYRIAGTIPDVFHDGFPQLMYEAVAELGAVRASDDDVRDKAEIVRDIGMRHDTLLPCHDTEPSVLQGRAPDSLHLWQADVEDAVCLRTHILDTYGVIVVDDDLPEAHGQQDAPLPVAEAPGADDAAGSLLHGAQVQRRGKARIRIVHIEFRVVLEAYGLVPQGGVVGIGRLCEQGVFVTLSVGGNSGIRQGIRYSSRYRLYKHLKE